jgi:hypothetical protein
MKANILLQGEIGSGKTRSLLTLLPEYIGENDKVFSGCDELQPFLISMEPGAEATLGANLCNGKNNPAIHHHYIPPASITWQESRNYIKLASVSSYESLLKLTDPNRQKYTQLLELYSTCADFICDGCTNSFGSIDDFGEDKVVALDGLTGLTKAAKMMWLGARPVIGKNDYQPIQSFIEGFLELLWAGTKCSAILIAHTDRRENELTGVSEITISTAGPALVRKLVVKPDEIITTERDERGQYVWNTLSTGNTVNKYRRLVEAPNLAPDFRQIFQA